MNDPSPDLIKDAEIHQVLNENQLSYDELFHHVDKNNDGKVDFNELIDLLDKVGIEIPSHQRQDIARVSSLYTQTHTQKKLFILIFFYLQRIISQGSESSHASSLSFQEFVNYVLKQERKLCLVFRNVDAGHQGRLEKCTKKNF